MTDPKIGTEGQESVAQPLRERLAAATKLHDPWTTSIRHGDESDIEWACSPCGVTRPVDSFDDGDELTHDHIADALLPVFAAYLREQAAADDVQRRLADEWHRDQCACEPWPADCVNRMLPPATWSAEAMLVALADSISPEATP